MLKLIASSILNLVTILQGLKNKLRGQILEHRIGR